MRVLVVMDAIGIGGITTAFLGYLSEISKRAECDILIFDESSVCEENLPSNIHVVHSSWILKIMGMPQKKVAGLSLFWGIIRSIFVLLSKATSGELSRRILLIFAKKLKNYDVAIGYTPDVNWHSLARGCNDFVLHNVEAKRKCAYIHCDYEKCGGYHKKQEKVYKKFDYILCVSNGCKESFLRCFPTLKEKAIVSGNFTDIVGIKQKAAAYQVARKSTANIVTVARISEEKGIPRTVSALARLKSQGYSFNWTVVGDGKDFYRIKELIEEKGLENHIDMVGAKKNPYPYIANADVFLLPSFHEAAPMVIGECWALGVPIISTETSSAKEMVEDEKIGVVCDNSEDGIYIAVKDFLDGKINMDSLVGLGKNSVNEKSTRQLEQFLRSVAEV